MKDLGTVPVMAYALAERRGLLSRRRLVAALHHGEAAPGCWRSPTAGHRRVVLPGAGDARGVRQRAAFPLPDLLTCSVGATCDDFSAIAQRLAGLGFPILWWEMPHRRRPEPGEPAVALPGGFSRPQSQVDFVRGELERVRAGLEALAGQPLDDERLAAGIAPGQPGPPLLAELRAAGLHGRRLSAAGPGDARSPRCWRSISAPTRPRRSAVLEELLAEVRRRVQAGVGVLPPDAVRVFWVNPVADLRVMNLLEDAAGGSAAREYLFCHALDPIPEDLPPLEALARMALADPMVGSPADRAERICRDVAAVRRRGGRHLADSRGQPLRAGRARSSATSSAGSSACPCWRSKCRRSPTPWSRRCARGWKRWWKRSKREPESDAHDLCRDRRGIAERSRSCCWTPIAPGGSVAVGRASTRASIRTRLAGELLDGCWRSTACGAATWRAVVATGYGRKLIRIGRRHGHRDHLPGLGRPPPRARGADDHRHRRAGQQARCG